MAGSRYAPAPHWHAETPGTRWFRAETERQLVAGTSPADVEREVFETYLRKQGIELITLITRSPSRGVGARRAIVLATGPTR